MRKAIVICLSAVACLLAGAEPLLAVAEYTYVDIGPMTPAKRPSISPSANVGS